MAQQDNTTNIDTVVTAKAGLVTDLNSSYIGKESYTYARNAVRNSKDGDLGTIGNEPSNSFCFNAPYKILGVISLPSDKALVCSGDGYSSEIGLANLKDCSYETLSTLKCWNFDPNFPIIGVAKKNFHKNTVVTFTDKKNPVKRIEVEKLTKLTNCDDVLLFKKISYPCLKVKKGQVGNIPNGTYSVALAYVIDNQVFSDWYAITNRIQLYSETGSNSIQVDLSNLDTEFDKFTLAVVGNYIDPVTKGATKVVKRIGDYSTKLRTVAITDFVNDQYKEIPLSSLVVNRKTWLTAGIISSNSNYLILADLVSRPEENYQLKAMEIKSEYVVEQVLADYYEKDGEDVGFYRDENYDFYIRGVYTTGETTEKYYIPGPKATTNVRSIVSSADVYEYEDPTSVKMERWQVENTAGEMRPYNKPFVNNRRVLGYGSMGYFESTEKLADNAAMFGKEAGTAQRYHKIPDECKVPRHETIDGKTYINIIGVRFKNIPRFNNPDIVGYQILRSDRKGGNGTVIARGIMTNIRSYTDPNLNQEVMFSNYGVNDLSPDQFISQTQTVWKNGQEHNFAPVENYYKDRFSFYSPHTMFEPRYSLGSELKIESEEVATVTGQFEKVYNHPKAKLLNQFSFWLSAAVGFIESVLLIAGKGNATGKSIVSFKGVTSGAEFEFDREFKINSVEDLVGLDLVGYITAQVKAGAFTSVISSVRTILTSIASLGIKIPYSIFAGIREADLIFNTIYDFTGVTDYVYQYNAHAKFDKSICIGNGNKRRKLTTEALYIPSDTVSIDDKTFSNYFREKCVYLHLNKPLVNPRTVDNTKQTMTSFGICNNPSQKVTSTGSAFYATSKTPNPNQYGRIGSAPSVTMHSCSLPFANNEQEGENLTETPILYGGDCIIARFQFQKRMQFFNQNLANTNYTNDTEYDYRLYRNIGYPRFWIDTTKYDFSQLLSQNVVNFSKFSRTTTSKYNLDCKGGKDGQSISRIDNAYMYTSHNTVLDFFVECDYNINFREKTDKPFFSKNNTNLSQIFRSDRLEFPEEFNVNRVYSDIYTTEVYSPQQREDFDPADPIPSIQPNSVIYSLPSFNLQNVDNWQYFLPANYFAFRESDFGDLTAIHKLDQDRIAFLFSASSPYISMGRDFLELEGSGRKITIGDGGLFAQDPREVLPTDNNYGACTSKYAFSNTHLGRFYPSEKQGRIINIEGLDDITRQGVSYWCRNYMPISLYKYFPNYTQIENPINGVGYLTVFDSFSETFYITKRDFAPKRELRDRITENGGSFYYDGNKVSLRDKTYFDDISWTLSYSPLDKGFISFHDWHPDWVLQTDNHFMTIKDNAAWKHNERWDSFCNYYGQDKPFMISFLSTSGQTIETVRNIQYLLEVYKYKNFGRDKFHVHHENFSHLIVKNSEQISPLLNLVLGNPNAEENLRYPIKNPNVPISFDIPFFKEENKYTINKFWDATKDRGEFTKSEFHLYPTDESGYKSVINPLAIDMDKPEEERKKFRHYFNEFVLIRDISAENKFIVKLLNVKKNLSIR